MKRFLELLKDNKGNVDKTSLFNVSMFPLMIQEVIFRKLFLTEYENAISGILE